MRLWSIHPRYLDPPGLVALWRETLLAKAVLQGKTRGYRHHPQLLRFQEHPLPRTAINVYLAALYENALERGYNFDSKKIGRIRACAPIPITSGQLQFELQHLAHKLAQRNPQLLVNVEEIKRPQAHPIFRVVEGPVALWERV